MAGSGGYGLASPVVGLAAAAVDQVRLSYHYLDADDRDGYDSLFHPDAVVNCPAGAQRHGTHSGLRLFAAGNQVAAIGRFDGRLPVRRVGVDFADIFTVTEHGLIVTRASYYFTAPG